MLSSLKSFFWVALTIEGDLRESNKDFIIMLHLGKLILKRIKIIRSESD